VQSGRDLLADYEGILDMDATIKQTILNALNSALSKVIDDISRFDLEAETVGYNPNGRPLQQLEAALHKEALNIEKAMLVEAVTWVEANVDDQPDSVLVPRDVLKRIDEYLSCYRDEGASDEGWASDQLKLDRAIVSLLLRQSVENTQ
jgi:hypothetical protein